MPCKKIAFRYIIKKEKAKPTVVSNDQMTSYSSYNKQHD